MALLPFVGLIYAGMVAAAELEWNREEECPSINKNSRRLPP